MRRSAAALGLTVVGLWLILTFKSSPASRASSSLNVTSPPTATSTVPGGPGDTSGAGAGAGPPGPGTTAPAGTSGQRSVTGSVFDNRYGPVQVSVTLNGTQILDVQALQMPTDRTRSADISRQAAPLLRDEVLQAQSAQIDTVGGATYTSASYAQSLQSAIDKAHA